MAEVLSIKVLGCNLGHHFFYLIYFWKFILRNSLNDKGFNTKNVQIFTVQ